MVETFYKKCTKEIPSHEMTRVRSMAEIGLLVEDVQMMISIMEG